MKISILDQSPVSEGQTAWEALQETVALAELADSLGYERFWVSEHHDAGTLAGSSPEVLLGHLAAKTKRIRLGSGGVMLPHYSAYKAVENFHVLASLAPGRVDMGIGRAPGGMPRASLALNDGKPRDKDKFPSQVDDVLAYIHGLPVPHAYNGVAATPVPPKPPEVWMLGSSLASAELAAEKGLPYTFAKFINGDGGKREMDIYRKQFQPSVWQPEPYASLAVFVVCAETDEEAWYLASSLELSLMQSGQGIRTKGTPPPERASAYEYGKFERLHVEENRKRMVVGTPETIQRQFDAWQQDMQLDEIMAVTILFDPEKKKKSFELLAGLIS